MIAERALKTLAELTRIKEPTKIEIQRSVALCD